MQWNVKGTHPATTDYVSKLEGSLRIRDEEIQSLRSHLDSYRNEVNELRSRLGIPLLSSTGKDVTGLGLMGPRSVAGDWEEAREDRKGE